MAKNISSLHSDLSNLVNKFKGKILNVIPDVIAVEGRNHFEESFNNQGFTDKSLKKWRRRQFNQAKKTKNGQQTKAYETFLRKDKGRAILISHQTDTKGTHLKDSIRTEKTTKHVIFATDKAYAQVHNEGGRSGRGTGFEMPQREFMGPSEALNKKIEDKLDHEIEKFLNNHKL